MASSDRHKAIKKRWGALAKVVGGLSKLAEASGRTVDEIRGLLSPSQASATARMRKSLQEEVLAAIPEEHKDSARYLFALAKSTPDVMETLQRLHERLELREFEVRNLLEELEKIRHAGGDPSPQVAIDEHKIQCLQLENEHLQAVIELHRAEHQVPVDQSVAFFAARETALRAEIAMVRAENSYLRALLARR